MDILNISLCLLNYFLISILFQNSLADVCQTCMCSKEADTTISINCNRAKFASINVLIFGLISVEYNGTISGFDLSENKITYLPPDMFQNSKRLKIINLSNNNLEEIHGSVFKNLNSLEVINLSNNKIQVFGITNLPSLRIMDLSHNMIKDLDLEFHKAYPQITDLKLSHNNLDDSINGTLTLLRNLKYLDLSHNNFNLLDSEDFNILTQLISLNLSNNLINSLSTQKFPDNLLELNVGFNSLTTFPSNLSKVQILRIEYNQINDIQDITDHLNELQYLNISGNMLKNLSDFKFSNLKTLDLSYNNFINIPKTLNKENYPVLDTLVFNGNLLQKIEFTSYLNIRTLIMRNMSSVETIDENSFKKLNHNEETQKKEINCLNLTLTDNDKLHYIDEKALEGLSLCYLDMKNNRFRHISPKLLNSGLKAKFGVDLEGNPFHCNCSLQWMLDDFIPWLYSTNPNLLSNLRCQSPENLLGKRMIHWYKWKERVLCYNTKEFSSRISPETLELLSRSNSVTLHISNGMLVILVIAVIILLVLISVGILLTKRLALRRTRINRRF